MILKAVVIRTTGGTDQEAEVQGLGGWSDAAKIWSPYGFKSQALAGSESILMRLGGIGELISLVVFDRRYSVTLVDGEVAIFDDQGQKVHLKRAGIEVSVPTGKTITVLGDDIRIGNGTTTLDSLVKWPALLTYLQDLSLVVTGTADLVTGTVAGMTTPPVTVPDMATTKTKAT
jgi:hypothetical protein